MAKPPKVRMKLPLQTDLTDDHLAGIGLVITQWAHVENLLAECIVEMLRMPHGLEPKDDAYLLPVLGMTGQTLLGLARSLFKIRSHSSHQEIDKLLDRFDVFLNLRNTLAHSASKRVDGTNKIEFLKIKTINKLQVSRPRYTGDGLHNEAYKLWILSVEFIRFMNERNILLSHKREAEIQLERF